MKQIRRNIIILFSVFCLISPCLVCSNELDFSVISSKEELNIKPELISLIKSKEYFLQGWWNWTSFDKGGLDKLSIQAIASKELNTYSSKNILDTKLDTTWAYTGSEKQWIVFDILATLDTDASTPFTITTIGIVPGYSKNETTWYNNNRIKKAKLVIYSPREQKDAWSNFEYGVFNIDFPDKMGLYIINVPEKSWVPNDYPMEKKVWLFIEELYKGTKYNDTCISEVIFAGGYNP